ncbi:unnamed protein product, partial [Symbiodinium sp. CCMP2456]
MPGHQELSQLGPLKLDIPDPPKAVKSQAKGSEVAAEIARSSDLEISLDSALADLGVGRKSCRQLRGELRLEDDSLASLLQLWRTDQRRVEMVLARLGATAAEAIAERLAVAEVDVVVGASRSQASGHGYQAADPPSPPSSAGSAEPSLDRVWGLLPRRRPGSEGQEERSRAFRRRVKNELSSAAQAAHRASQAALREAGPKGAEAFVSEVWSFLQSEECCEEMMVEIVCSQTDPEIQRALRSVIRSSSDRRKSASRASSADMSQLPEAYLLHVLFFLGSAADLAAFGAASSATQDMSEQDALWLALWQQPPPTVEEPGGARRQYLLHLAAQCVECGCHTDFEHAILGRRLCEACERAHSKYALIRSHTAVKEYQLPLSAMNTLAHMDGVTGRVYLRASVSSLAD